MRTSTICARRYGVCARTVEVPSGVTRLTVNICAATRGAIGGTGAEQLRACFDQGDATVPVLVHTFAAGRGVEREPDQLRVGHLPRRSSTDESSSAKPISRAIRPTCSSA